MAVRIVSTLLLTPAEVTAVSARIAAPEHVNDNGACMWWDRSGMAEKYCVAYLESGQSREPIGVLFADGPPESTGAAWWIDSRQRGKKLGSAMIDAYAVHLQSQGVRAIGKIRVDTYAGEYDEQSGALVRRLRSHFP